MKQRVIFGFAMVIFGLFLIILDLYVRIWAPTIYGFIFLVIGLAIIMNQKEDVIEKRKDVKTKNIKARRGKR